MILQTEWLIDMYEHAHAKINIMLLIIQLIS